jgi:hypothetical protein
MMGRTPLLQQVLHATTSPTGSSGLRKRPFGVYIIVLLQALNAVTHGAGVISGIEDPVVATITEQASEAVATALMIVGLGVAIGLLLLKRWAWVATMLWVGAAMAAELLLYFRGDDANYGVMAISVAQVLYLNLSDVQAAFGRRRTSEVVAS